jgi:hypothetical protein
MIQNDYEICKSKLIDCAALVIATLLLAKVTRKTLFNY